MTKNLFRKHPSGSNFRLVAVCFRGSKVVSYGFNREKTHPFANTLKSAKKIDSMYEHSQNDYISNCIHAEMDAVRKASGEFDTVVVYRELACGHQAIAKPCLVCEAKLRSSGVKNVFYSNSEGFEKLDLA